MGCYSLFRSVIIRGAIYHPGSDRVAYKVTLLEMDLGDCGRLVINEGLIKRWGC